MADEKRRQFDALIAPHLERLFRAACRLLGNAADAQDLVQDTCVTACENLAALGANTHPLRWLLRVQHNRFIDGARRRRRAPVVVLDVTARAAAMPSDRPGPDELLLQAEAERALERAFLALEESQRILLTLRAEGYDLAEIEAITGISRDVLRARLHRARRSLAQRIEELSGAPPRAARIGSGT
jgi:RNA polymerase sigma-70 factor (ECF subfamily)